MIFQAVPIDSANFCGTIKTILWRIGMNKNQFQKFIDRVKYNPVSVEDYNKYLSRMAFSEACEKENKRLVFGYGREGCCLNFSLALLGPLKGTLISCKDNDGIHFAVVYRNNENVFCVCDPAGAKVHEGDPDFSIDNYFDVPLKDYSFLQGEKNEAQQYCIWTNFNAQDDDKKMAYGISLTKNPALLEKYANKPLTYTYLAKHICPLVGETTAELEKLMLGGEGTKSVSNSRTRL